MAGRLCGVEVSSRVSRWRMMGDGGLVCVGVVLMEIVFGVCVVCEDDGIDYWIVLKKRMKGFVMMICVGIRRFWYDMVDEFWIIFVIHVLYEKN